MTKSRKKKLMAAADKILDDYNNNKIDKEQLSTAMMPISNILNKEAT